MAQCMVIALDSGSNGPGSSPGPGHCVVFLKKTPYSLHLNYNWILPNLMLRLTLRWTSISSRLEYE